jgi:hypothetical protein
VVRVSFRGFLLYSSGNEEKEFSEKAEFEMAMAITANLLTIECWHPFQKFPKKF